jgi:hypothetical protein
VSPFVQRYGVDRKQVERDAIAYAKRYLERQGYGVVDVTRTRGHNGYDLLAQREGEQLKIEVKGCTRPWQIPDPYVTEFDGERRLVADLLYVVYFLDGGKPELCIIPRDAIDPDMITPRQGWRISPRFKNETVLARYMVTFDPEA